jgi:hypothetical protein
VAYLSELPPAWVKRLKEPARRSRKGTGFDGDTSAWLGQLPHGSYSSYMSPDVRSALRKALRDLDQCQVTGDSRHDVMVRATGRLVHLGAERKRGVEEALMQLSDAYLAAVPADWTRDPQGELDRAIAGAVAKYGGRRRQRVRE